MEIHNVPPTITHPLTVTTRMITVSVGNPYNPLLGTVIECGMNPRDTSSFTVSFSPMCHLAFQVRLYLHFRHCLPPLQEMFQASLADVVGFSAVISSCEKAFQWQASLDLFRCLAGN